MAAPAGNQFWKARSSHGRRPIFSSAEALWDACVEYFQWVEDNPLQSAELVTFQGAGKLVDVPKMRAMTITGLCIFLDIDSSTWRVWASDKTKDFFAITTRVDEIVRTQKFEGAAGGFLNPNIIARDLGLAERSELTGKDGGAIEVDDIRKTAREVAFMLARARQQAE
jgi:hypothetical protein